MPRSRVRLRRSSRLLGVFIVPLRGSYEKMFSDPKFVDLQSKSIDELADIFFVCNEHGTRELAEQVLEEIERRSSNAPRPVHSVPGWFPVVFWHQHTEGEGGGGL